VQPTIQLTIVFLSDSLEKERKKRDPMNNINQKGATGKILSQLNMEKKEKAAVEKKKKEEEAKSQGTTLNKAMEAMSNKPALAYNAAAYTTGRASASLTSTAVSVSTTNDRALMSHEEYMFPLIKAKGYGTIVTNYGKINIELFCDQVRTEISLFFFLLFFCAQQKKVKATDQALPLLNYGKPDAQNMLQLYHVGQNWILQGRQVSSKDQELYVTRRRSYRNRTWW